jgi:hypothetical protein
MKRTDHAGSGQKGSKPSSAVSGSRFGEILTAVVGPGVSFSEILGLPRRTCYLGCSFG